VCTHLGEHTNSNITTPRHSLARGMTPEQANWFLNITYGMGGHTFTTNNEKLLCSTHFQHMQKRLPRSPHPTAAGDDSISTNDYFKQQTGATWVGHLYRRCIGCNTVPTQVQRLDPMFWSLAGGKGPDTFCNLTAYLRTAHPVTYAPAYSVEWGGSENEQHALPAHMAASEIPIGQGEWLCTPCWQRATACEGITSDSAMPDRDEDMSPAEQQHQAADAAVSPHPHNTEACPRTASIADTIATAASDLETVQSELRKLQQQSVDADRVKEQRLIVAQHAAVLSWLQLIQQRGAALLQECTDTYDATLQDMAEAGEIEADDATDKNRYCNIRRSVCGSVAALAVLSSIHNACV